MRKKIVKLGILIVAILFLFMLVGCDSFISVKGKVYEWVDAPVGSHSFIYVNILEDWRDYEIVLNELEERIPEDIKTSPLNHAQIKVNGRLASEEYVSTHYMTTSNISGEFELFSLAQGGRYGIEIKSSRIGYIGVAGKAVYDTTYAHDYAVLAVLVKDENWEWQSK
ncbi:MAG: hypothetical protein V1932_04175 [Chloroflexota bacterium]